MMRHVPPTGSDTAVPTASTSPVNPEPVPDAARDGEGERIRPLSSGQRGIALQQLMVPHSPIFNVPAALELLGPLDRQALTHALTQVIRRHDVLRSRLAERDGTLIQIVDPPSPADLPVHDMRHLPPSQRYAAARTLLDAEAARPIDLFHEHGLRLRLIVLDDDRHVLFWTMHHLVCDGWSKSVFARDLSLLYAGRGEDMPALSVTYGEHIAQERAVDADVIARQLAYWERHLDGVHELSGVTPDRPRQAGASQHGAEIAFSIDAATRRRISALARTRGASEFMVLHAAMATLIHRISGEPDVVIDTPYGGRPSSEFEHLIGFFVNVLPLRSRVPDDLAFADLIDQVRATALDGYDHHLAPFHQIVSQLTARYGGRVGPLHQVSFAFANVPYLDVELAGLQTLRFALTRIDIRYELEWHLWQDDETEGYGGRLIYRRDLFDEPTAAALTTAYQHLLAAAGTDPSQGVAVLTSDLALPVARPNAAPAPAPPRVDAAQPPLTVTQSAVEEIWAELLHQEDIGVLDDFFAIGGHSLAVALMAAKIRETFGVDLTIRRIVQSPTIADIAAAIDAELQPAGPHEPATRESADER